ncbi:MAG: acyl--CoA ligase [Haliea sp.]|nr:acyl--CoA ligase [Haliea sp.]
MMRLQILTDYARENPSKPAVVHNGRTFSYAEFAGAIRATAGHLETEELPAGHTIAVIVHNLLDCWLVVLALQALGLHTVTVRSTAMIEALELNNLWGMVTTEREALEYPLEPEAGANNRLVIIPNPVFTNNDLSGLTSLGGNRVEGGHILYTSGTTGKYKKVFLGGDLQQQRNAQRIQSNSYAGADTIYHCVDFGLWTALGYRNPLATWQLGGCVILEQRPEWYEYLLQSRITHASLIPGKVQQLLAFLADQSAATPAKDFKLIVTGGFISRKLAEQIINRITKNLENAYASTEIYTMLLRSKVTDLDELHWLLPTGYRTIEIVDAAGNPCPVGVEGQLRIGLTELDCSAYMDNPQASQTVFRSGYFYPGDMAVQRADGRIRILGRSVDVINYLGQKLSVAPLEQEIQDRLGVDSVCLFSGLEDEGYVELVIAIESAQWPEQSELDKLNNEFSQFERVQIALFMQFPRTSTGTHKIDRMALRKLIFPEHGASD